MSTFFDRSVFGQFSTNTGHSTGLLYVKPDANSNHHEVTVCRYGNTGYSVIEGGTGANCKISYRPPGFSTFIDMSVTVDLSSGKQSKLFTGVYDRFKFTPQNVGGTTHHVQVWYHGWRE